MYDKRKLALLYRIIIVIVSSIALFVNFKLMTFRLGILYFTNLSNLFSFKEDNCNSMWNLKKSVFVSFVPLFYSEPRSTNV